MNRESIPEPGEYLYFLAEREDNMYDATPHLDATGTAYARERETTPEAIPQAA